MRKWVAALLLVFCAPVWGVEYPVSWPERIDQLDFIVTTDGVAAVSWEQNDGKRYCAAGYVGSLGTVARNLTAKQAGETLTEYLERNRTALITRDLKDIEVKACSIMAERNKAVWKVTPWRTKPTRNVYSLTNFPSVKTKIGEIAVGTTCGATVASYSATIKVYEWRRVALPTGIEGATVCRKQ